MRGALPVGADITNAFGFNDIDRPNIKPEGVRRLAIIGDSFVFGVVPRAANFVSDIQRYADGAQANVEVLNMGIPGAGPKNYLRMIRKDAVDRQADIVGVVLFLGNDLLQSHPDFDTRIWIGDAREVLVSPFSAGWSMEYSSLARMVRASSRMLRERLSAPHEGTFTRRSFLEIERQRQAVFETPMPTFIRECYSSLVDIVQQMKAVADAHGMTLFVVLAPDEIQIERDLQMEVSRTSGADRANYDYGALPGNLANDLESAGVATLNLQSAFEARGTTEALYATNDTHWNEAGNAVAANAIWTFLQARTIVR
jgi:lysophospholipase L1-like esterase